MSDQQNTATVIESSDVSILINNYTDNTVVANGIPVVAGKLNGGNLAITSEGVHIQIPGQGLIQIWPKKGDDGTVLVTSGYYKNEFDYDTSPSQDITVEIYPDNTFTVECSQTIKANIQKNNELIYSFAPLADQPFAYPWEITQQNYAQASSQSSNKLNFSYPEQSSLPADMPTTLTLQNPMLLSQGVQIDFDMQVNAFTNNSPQMMWLQVAENFSFRLQDDGSPDSYWTTPSSGSWQQANAESQIRANGKWHHISIIIFPNRYVLIEDGKQLISTEYASDNNPLDTLVQYACTPGFNTSSLDLNIKNIVIGNPMSQTEQQSVLPGSNCSWQSDYTYSNDNYSCTKPLVCKDVIASIYYSSDSAEKQQIVIRNIKTQETIVKETDCTGSAYRAPFADPEYGYICFPINNQFYYIFDMNSGTFIAENVNLFSEITPPNKTPYSEEICHKGIIYLLGYDRYWRFYDIAAGTQLDNFFCETTYSDFRRVLKPMIVGNRIYACIYTNHDDQWTEIVSYKISIDDEDSEDPLEDRMHYITEYDMRSENISHDRTYLYYWNTKIRLVAVRLDNLHLTWTKDYGDSVNNVSSLRAPVTDGRDLVCLITDSGDVSLLKTVNDSYPAIIKTYSVGETFNKDAIKYYPSSTYAALNMMSEARIVEGHLIYQGYSGENLYSLNLDTGVVQVSAVQTAAMGASPTHFYANDFSTNNMSLYTNGRQLNLMQLLQYEKNFYFDGAMMAMEYEAGVVNSDGGNGANQSIAAKPVEGSCYYNVTVGVQDDYAAPVDNVVYIRNQGETITIKSPLIEAAGGELELAKGESVTFKPGPDGRFNFQIPATGLYCPSLHVWADFMLPSTGLVFFPNQSNTDVLRNQQEGDIADAVDFQGNPVFKEPYTQAENTSGVVQMIQNSVGGSAIGDDDASDAAMLLSPRQRQLAIKQELLSEGDYRPVLTDDHCAFAGEGSEDNTDNCICSVDPDSPAVDRPYLEDASTYTSGVFVIDNGIQYDPDSDGSQWQSLLELHARQVESMRQDASIDDPEGDSGFAGFVKNCVHGNDAVQSYAWESQQQAAVRTKGRQFSFKKTFEVIISAGKTVYRFLVNTVEKGLQVLHSFFTQVANGIRVIIEWLTWLYNWKDIIHCQENLYNLAANNFDKSVEEFAGLVPAWTDKIDKTFQEFEETIDLNFDVMEQVIGGDSFNDASVDHRNPRQLYGEGADNTMNQSNYLNEQLGIANDAATALKAQLMDVKLRKYDLARARGLVRDYPQREELHSTIDKILTLQVTVKNADLTKGFLKTIGDEVANWQHLLGELVSTLADQLEGEALALFKAEVEALTLALNTNVNNIAQLFQLGLVTFLELIKNLVIFLLEAMNTILDDLVAIIPEALASIGRILTAEIDLDIVNNVWNIVHGTTGEKATVLGMTTLLVALPMTLTIKLFGGNSDNNVMLRPNGIPRHNTDDIKDIIAPIRLTSKDVAIFNCCATFIAADLDTVSDALGLETEPEAVRGAIMVFSSIQLVLDAVAVSMNYPTESGDEEPTGMMYAVWGTTVIKWPIDLTYLIGAYKRKTWAETKPTADCVYGALFLVMNLLLFNNRLEDDSEGIFDAGYDCVHSIIAAVPLYCKPLSQSPDPRTKEIVPIVDAVFGLVNSLMYLKDIEQGN